MKKVVSLITSLSVVTSTLLAGGTIELDPIIEDVVPGKRVVLNAIVEDSSGVDVARTYFKSADGANYSFVPMSCDGTACSSTLPAVSEGTEAIDYLVLVKNGANEVYKTQTFSAVTLPVGTALPGYQLATADGTIKVSTELAKAPEMVQGFHDNVLMDSVEDSARLGVVAGITAGTTTATATSVGTVTATSAGFSTTTLVVAGVVGAAAVGGTAAAVSNSGSSDTPTYTPTYTPTDTNTTTATCSDVTGSWYGATHYSDGSPDCTQLFVSITQSGCDISTGSFYSCSDTGETVQVTGTVSGTVMTYASSANGVTFQGDIATNSISGTWSNTSGSTGTFSLSK